mgnify:CR=1 FL=1
MVLRHRENLGKGAAIKTALRYIQRELWNTDVIGVMDADGQHRTEDMVRLLRLALYLIVIWLAFSGGRERNRKYRDKDHPGRTSKKDYNLRNRIRQKMT